MRRRKSSICSSEIAIWNDRISAAVSVVVQEGCGRSKLRVSLGPSGQPLRSPQPRSAPWRSGVATPRAAGQFRHAAPRTRGRGTHPNGPPRPFHDPDGSALRDRSGRARPRCFHTACQRHRMTKFDGRFDGRPPRCAVDRRLMAGEIVFGGEGGIRTHGACAHLFSRQDRSTAPAPLRGGGYQAGSVVSRRPASDPWTRVSVEPARHPSPVG